MAGIYRYYVEGECEKHFLDTYKSGVDPVFHPGKVEVFNVMTHIITQPRLINFSKNTTLVLVYDTDQSPTDIFEKNLEQLKKNKHITKIIHVQSVKNFEEELVYSSDLSNINEMFSTKSASEFKTKFNGANITSRMKKINFDFLKIWSRNPPKSFSKYKQGGNEIKESKYKI